MNFPIIADPEIKIPTYNIRGWVITAETGTAMLNCPDCGARIPLAPYLQAIGTRGTRFCPYCGHEVQPKEGPKTP